MGIGDAAHSQGDVMRRIHKLEGLVRELVAGRRLENASVGEGGITFRGEGGITLTAGGGVTITDNGRLQLRDTDGTAIVDIGPDPMGHPAFRLRRADGSYVMSTYGSEQFGRDYWSFWDNSGNIVVSDDAETGWGLAKPRTVCALYPTASSLTAIGTSTETGWDTLWDGECRAENPFMQVGFVLSCPGSARAECRILFNNTEVYTSGFQSGYTTINTGRISVREHVNEPGGQLRVKLEARNEAADQTCYLVPVGVYAP